MLAAPGKGASSTKVAWLSDRLHQGAAGLMLRGGPMLHDGHDVRRCPGERGQNSEVKHPQRLLRVCTSEQTRQSRVLKLKLQYFGHLV